MAISLDPSQQQFCDLDGGAVRLLAPAGSGKTQSLLHRCRALAERSGRTKPRFLIFTFTRAARDELHDRLRSNPAFGEIAPLVSITTLNSWGFRLVKNFTTHLKLVTTSQDRYFCIQNVLQPVWQKYPFVKSLMEDSRRRSRAGQELLQMFDFLKSMGFRHDALDSVQAFSAHLGHLMDCGMQTQLKGFFKNLAEFAQRYGEDYAAFYQDVGKAIATLARIFPDEEEEENKGGDPGGKLPLHLMTALRAKGKEFDAVIVLDANDGIWPSKLAKTANDREQERRLFYVAMTRARRYLYFIVNDSILGEVRNPSPYLAEMGLGIPETRKGA